MSVPADPTIAEIVTEGLKRGGVVSPTATQITDTTTHQLREVKTDIQAVLYRHPLLRTTASNATVQGVSRVAQPTDVDTVELVELVDVGGGLAGDATGWRGTAQAGASTTLTLAAGFNVTDTNNVIGKYLFLTGGTGANQYRQIKSYDNTTKVATVDTAWTTTPGGTTTYIVGKEHYRIYDMNRPNEEITLVREHPWIQLRPRAGQLVGETLWLDRAPDAIYALLWTYWADLDRLDDAGTVFITFLREYRSLFIQGVAVKVNQRYDDERYQQELQVYLSMLQALAVKTRTMNQQHVGRDAQMMDSMMKGSVAPQVVQQATR